MRSSDINYFDDSNDLNELKTTFSTNHEALCNCITKQLVKVGKAITSKTRSPHHVHATELQEEKNLSALLWPSTLMATIDHLKSCQQLPAFLLTLTQHNISLSLSQYKRVQGRK